MMTDKTKRKPRQPRKITPQYLENAALYYLQRYASSTGNLRRVLMRKVKRSSSFHGTDAEEGAMLVEKLLERYQRSGLLNDNTYARESVLRLRRRGMSRRGLTEKLKLKGLSETQIKAALAEAAGEEPPDTDPELAAATAFARRRKLGPFRRDADRETHRQKDMAALGRAGFGFEIARAVIDEDDDPHRLL